MPEPTVIGVDWSGRESGEQIHHIRSCVITPDRSIEVWADLTRADLVDELLAVPGDLVVGFDFSFAFPRWVYTCLAIDAPAMWALARAEGEAWLRDCPEPFFGKPGSRRRTDIELWRDTEREHAAKSTFQIGGAGAVGTGSIRGMPRLIDLRAGGFSVCPFDAPSHRMIVEIYPRVLRPHANASDLPSRVQRAVENSEDTRDAVLSALVMWEHRATFASYPSSADPEGRVWTPN